MPTPRLIAPSLLLAALLAASPALAGEPVAVRAAQHDAEGFGRIAFDWPAAVQCDATIEGDTLRIQFARPMTGALDAIAKHLDGYLADAHLEESGNTVVAKLKRRATVRSFASGNTVAVDLVLAAEPHGSASREAKPAARPQATVSPAPHPAVEAPVGVRFAQRHTTRRVVLDWHGPVDYTVSQENGAAVLLFDRGGVIDRARLALALPGLAPSWEQEMGATRLSLAVPVGTELHHARKGGRIVLDLTPVSASEPPLIDGKPVERLALIEPAAGAAIAAAEIGPPRSLLPAAAPQAIPADAMPVHFTLGPSGGSMRFDWPAPVGAAVFRRGATLWLVFPGAKALDLMEPGERGRDFFTGMTQLADAKATVLRLGTRHGINPTVRRADNSWIVDFKSQAAGVDAPIAIETRAALSAPTMFFGVGGAGETIYLRDPEIGDLLAVIPVNDVGRGVGAERQLVDFRVLPSVQGLALRPNVDDLVIRRAADGIEVGRPGGLMLASETDRQLAAVPEDGTHRLFDYESWRGPRDRPFLQQRARLLQAIAAAPPAYRSKPRLALARFYFANLFAAEAQGVLEALQHDDPEAMADPSVQLMSGAVMLLAGDQKGAGAVLGQKMFDDEGEARVWRGSLAAETADWDTAARNFVQVSEVLARHPKALRNRFALQAAESFLETDQADAAPLLLDVVLKDAPATADRAMALYLDGRVLLAHGERDQALARWDEVAAMADRPSRARALMSGVLTRLDAGEIGRAEAIKELDGLRFAWRGDRFEFMLMRKLGELKLADGDLGGAFEAMHEVAANFPDYPGAGDVMKQLSTAFADLFLGDAMAEMSPLKALALYADYKDFAPVGERGDIIVRRLVDRLVAVDLLDDAATLLEDQVTHRLNGRDKARVAAQLALLRLFDHKPDRALAALDIEVDKDIPAELLRQRQQLRSRALAELNRNDEALAILASDTSRDADRLRADIYWRTHNWSEASKTFARLVAVPAPGAALDKESSQLVLNWASALTLAGDQRGLAELRGDYGPAMAKTSLAGAFRVVAGDVAVGGDGDPRSIAKRVAQLGELQSFMAGLKERVAKDKLSDIN